MLEILLLIGLVIGVGFAARWVFERTRVPEILILLLAGFALGPLGLMGRFIGNIDIAYFQGVAPVVGAVAIISLMFDAGAGLRVKGLPDSLSFSSFSALLNTAACALSLAGILHFILGWGPNDSLLLGLILGGLSSYAAYSILPLVRTTNSMRSALCLESTLSTILMAIASIGLMRYGALSAQGRVQDFAGAVFSQFSISFILGIALGLVMLGLLAHFRVRKVSSFALFAALLVVYFADFAYFGGIGVVSVAILGFALSNSEWLLRAFKKPGSFEIDGSFGEIRREMRVFINAFFFTYLGMVFRPGELTIYNVAVAVLLVAAILVVRILVSMFLGRVSKVQLHENVLRSVLVQRDLLSATLATFIFIYPGSAGFGIEPVYMVIAISTIATTIGVNWYEKIFRDSFLFSKRIALKDGREVLVRSFTRDDFGKLRKFFNGLVEEGAYIAIDRPVSNSEERKMDEDNLARMNSREMIVWVVQSGGKIVGRVSAERMQRRERDNVSLSFYISKEFRGAGLGTVLIRLIVNESVKVFEPHNLYLTVYSNNRKAIALYVREGFEKLGVLPDWMRNNDSYMDRVYMVYRPGVARGKGFRRRRNKGK